MAPKSSSFPYFFYGIVLVGLGLSIYLLAAAAALGAAALHGSFGPAHRLLLASVVPFLCGAALAGFDLLVLYPKRQEGKIVRNQPPASREVTVALTAYNDEESIGPAVRDFKSHSAVTRVIVVSNGSTDRTLEEAKAAGAIVFDESRHGYGRCVYRCFEEALKHADAKLILLCEGDMTFRAADIEKFLAYIPHATIVNGTRIVEQLRMGKTQLTTFIYHGNFFVGKLLEAKHLGKGTFTDVGTTYKLCRRDALERLMPFLNPGVDLEFNAHFLDAALERGELLVECPITFYPRVGQSKGGNVNDLRALRVGIRMILGLLRGFFPLD